MKQTYFGRNANITMLTTSKGSLQKGAYSSALLENGVLKISRKQFKFDPVKPVLLAGFDVDGTLVVTKSGYVFPRGGDDWKLMPHITHFESIIERLKKDNPNHQCVLVLFTNQGSTLQDPRSKSYINLNTKLQGILDSLSAIDLAYASLITTMPVSSATNRKPHVHMFNLFESEIPKSTSIDMKKSFYVGDAAGRAGDHSDVDLMFARNANLKFMTPEEYFMP